MDNINRLDKHNINGLDINKDNINQLDINKSFLFYPSINKFYDSNFTILAILAIL